MAICPANLGYRMPAEWEPHEATWVAWPHERTDWPGKFAAIPWVFAEIVRHLHRCEQVNILVNDKDHETLAKRVLKNVDINWNRVHFWRIPTDRGWMRDCGPIFVTDPKGKLALTNWRFNGWAKYPNWKRDNAVPSRIVRKLKLPFGEPKSGSRLLVLEGGSIDVNGQGLLLTTEECLLGAVQQRNPGLQRADLERAFADYLGIRKVLWLGQG